MAPERDKSNSRMNLPDPDSVQRITVLGAGTIGAGWTVHFLAHGKDVTVYDVAPAAESRVRAFVADAWPSMLRLGATNDATPPDFRFVNDPATSVQDAQFIQESAPEDLATKVALYEQIETTMPENTVLATSTSGLLISELQQDRIAPQRYVVGHPFNPPHIMPIVEVVGGRQTDTAVVDWVSELYRVQGKRPIQLQREVRGHLINRLQVALWREAVHAVDSGIASVEDVDMAVVHALGLRWAVVGPHLTIHLAGGPGGMRHHIEHMGPSIEKWWKEMGVPRLTDEVKEKLISGEEDSIDGRTHDELITQRDATLVDLLSTMQCNDDIPPRNT